MTVTARDIVPLTKARAGLTRLCEEVHQGGREMIITKNGESCAALIDTDLLDHYHQLERENIHLILLEEAIRGVEAFKAGKTIGLAQIKKRYGR